MLEEKVESLIAGGGGSGGGDTVVPDPIFTCVQCQEEYQESQNAEGCCNYHPSSLKFIQWNYVYVVLCIRLLNITYNT